MRSLDELMPKPDGPTMREIVEESEAARRELDRTFPGGITVYSEKSTDPSEGDCYTEDGRVMVYTGGMWKQLSVSAPRAMGGPIKHPWDPSMHTPLGFAWPHDPETKGMDWADIETRPGTGLVDVPEDPDAIELRGWEELLEVLLCEDCNFELSAPACSPAHAYLADNPAEHRLIKPLVKRSVDLMRWTTGHTCAICSEHGKPSVSIGTGDCMHVDRRGQQVMMHRKAWEEVCDEAAQARGMEAVLNDPDTRREVEARMEFAHRHMSTWIGTDTDYFKDTAERVLGGIKRRMKGT